MTRVYFKPGHDRKAIVWSADMVAILRLDCCDRIKADLLKVSQCTVVKQRKILGIASGIARPPVVSQNEKAEIEAAWGTSETVGQIALRLGFTVLTVRRHAQRLDLGLKGTCHAHRGEAQAKAITARRCLSCNASIQSTGFGHRMCQPCRTSNHHDGLNW